MLLTPFPAHRIRIDSVATRRIDWPHFAGSMLRGAFGHSLRRASCVTGASSCDGCAVRLNCPYSIVFEPLPPAQTSVITHAANTATPPAYVIEPPPLGARAMTSGETLSFHIVLIGPALKHQVIVLHALSAALGTLTDMPGALQMTTHNVIDAPTGNASNIGDEATLTFSTPLRVQRNGNPIRSGNQLTSRDVLMSAVKRVANVCETLLGASTADITFRTLADTAAMVEMTHTLEWHELARHSSRQQQRIPLSGLIGAVQLRGELAPFAPYLHLGQWLHIGKETAFGLGQYRVESPLPR